jgi:hypothetical protein
MNFFQMKYEYMYFDAKFIGKKFINFVNDDICDIDNIMLMTNLKKIFTYLNENDLRKFVKYCHIVKILNCNKIKMAFKMSDFNDYINNLEDERILLDVSRVFYSKKFIHKMGVCLRDGVKPTIIDTRALTYIDEERIYYYTPKRDIDTDNFALLEKNICRLDKQFKYLFHQDIHNSFINPILIMILSVNHYKNTGENGIVQLNKIKQIYRNISIDEKMIEIFYYIDDFYIYKYDSVGSLPKLVNIDPHLLIKCFIKIDKFNYKIYLTY